MASVLGVRLYIVRARDHAKVAAFYRDGLGLPINRATETFTQFRLPDGLLLDVEDRPKTVLLPDYATRVEAPASLMLDTDDVEGMLAQALAHGGRLVDAPFTFGDRRVAYVADPEGHVIGLVQGPGH